MAIDLSLIKKSEVVKGLGQSNILIYGRPKTGKTTFAAKIPNSFFIATELGQNYISVFKEHVNDWKHILDVCMGLAKKNHPYKVVVIDIADIFYKHCEQYVMEREGVVHPSDLGFGKGWALVKDEFTRVVTKINALGFPIVFISHEKDKVVKKKGSEYTAVVTTLEPAAEKIITGLCDFILYAYRRDDGSRVMRTVGTKYILAGGRYQGPLPELLPLDYEALDLVLKGEKVELPKVKETTDV